MARSATKRESLSFDPGLESLMHDAGVSYRALAERTGLSAGYLNHLAHGNRPVPSDDVIQRIAKALGVKPDRFLEFRVRRVADVLRRKPDVADKVYKELVKR